jgi:hypothetical protein
LLRIFSIRELFMKTATLLLKKRERNRKTMLDSGIRT